MTNSIEDFNDLLPQTTNQFISPHVNFKILSNYRTRQIFQLDALTLHTPV